MRSAWAVAMFAVAFEATAARPAPAPAPAPEKFIPTFAIKYGSTRGIRPREETAKFDMLIVSAGEAYPQAWAEGGSNSWRSLKALNPDMVILVYNLGPGEYNTSDWGQFGEGWEWLKQNHGVDAADRWVARGVSYRTVLHPRTPWPHERLMVLGNRNWRRYWLEGVYEKNWGRGRFKGTDGIFSDVTGYRVSYSGRWHRPGHRDQPDHPETYYANGRYLHDKWKDDTNTFFAEALPWLGERGLTLAVNFHIVREKFLESWRELDIQPQPPCAAMMEGGFVCPYGRGSFNTWEWGARVKALQSMKNVPILMTCHGNVDTKKLGLARMDVSGESSSHGDKMTGWEALWFSMTSFLIAFDDVGRNGFMNFTVWHYTEYYWLDEFDPRYLHLGRARGGYRKWGSVYLREFDDGWVVVNPTKRDARNLRVPRGWARVIDHGNFKKADAAPPVTRFDLPAHRGIVLLRHGRKIGNEDNLP